jgi:hypothetical protein
MKKKSSLEKTISALPPNPRKARKWSLEEDAMLFKYAESKGVNAIAKVLGIPTETARRRLVYLKSKVKQ